MKILILSIFFLCVSSSIPGKLYCVCEYWTYQTIGLMMKIIRTCFEHWVSYDWRVTAMKLSLEALRMPGSRLLGLPFMYAGRGMYGQATFRLVNSCVTGCDELASNQQWVVSRSSTIVFSTYLALKTNLVQRKTLIPLDLLCVTDGTHFRRWV